MVRMLTTAAERSILCACEIAPSVYPLSPSRTTDDEALHVQLEAAAAHAAWQAGSWEAFDQLPADQQDAAWAQLAHEQRHRTDGIAEAQGIIDPPPVAKPQRQRPWTPPRRPDQGRDLDGIPTSEYVHALTGHDIEPGRRADCPLPDHDDHSHDFHAYQDTPSWNCYGCNRGGRIFQFAAHLWDYQLPLRGDTFREVRDRLHEVFG